MSKKKERGHRLKVNGRNINPSDGKWCLALLNPSTGVGVEGRVKGQKGKETHCSKADNNSQKEDSLTYVSSTSMTSSGLGRSMPRPEGRDMCH